MEGSKESGVRQAYLKAPGEKRRPPTGLEAIFHLDEPGVPGLPLHHNLANLPHVAGGTGQAVQTLLLATMGVWAADKYFPRVQAADAWSRGITLHLPTSPVCAPLLPRLAHILHLLTGDAWTLVGRETSLDLGWGGRWTEPWEPDAVALFSGGLDSLAGAIDLLEKGQRLLLVSHHDFGQLAGQQQHLGRALAGHYGPSRLQHLGLRVQFPETRELSLRSRSLLYLSLGLAAVAGVGPDTPVIIPENGWISLNPPLTGNRLGSLSTRTTHFAILAEITALWREAGLSTLLINPYQSLSKGEALAACANPGLLRQLAPLTLSCARPVVSRWRSEAAGHCGYCYPCLVRRAALHRLGWDDPAAYRVDVLLDLDISRDRTKGQDLRALLLALDTWQTAPQELTDRLWLGDDPARIPERLAWARRLLQSGCTELGHWLRGQGGAGISEYMD